jgi:hypothetical protein
MTSTAAYAATATGTFQVGLADGNTAIYDGNGVGSVYLWGAQLEAAAFASSYIPTTTASVARNADVLTYPLPGALKTEGTCYAELSSLWTDPVTSAFAVTIDNAEGRALYRAASATGSQEISVFDGTGPANKASLTDMNTGSRKRASSWGPLGLATTGDGASAGTAAFDGQMGTTGSGLHIGCNTGGGNQWFGGLKNVKLWKRQMPHAQLASITA